MSNLKKLTDELNVTNINLVTLKGAGGCGGKKSKKKKNNHHSSSSSSSKSCKSSSSSSKGIKMICYPPTM